MASVSLFSCTKDDPAAPVEPPRDYNVQYNTEIELIETYLKTNYIKVIDNPGGVDDQDVTIKKLEIGDVVNKSIWDQKKYQLLVRPVKVHNIEYKLYYLVLRAGIGVYPTNTDNILTSYKGEYLSSETILGISSLKTTFFEEVKFPQTMKDLSGLDLLPQGFDLIKGWKEIFPQFRTGTSTVNGNGTVSHFDFGAGVMFIPSGLAYYNTGSGGIPAYAPLVFSFKLYEIQRLDHDSDGIIDIDEDLDNDRYLPYFRELVKGTAITDDTDKDGNPDYLDSDDDGDNYTTKLEIRNPLTGSPYLFENIPSCDGNTSSPTRIKKYLDKNCH